MLEDKNTHKQKKRLKREKRKNSGRKKELQLPLNWQRECEDKKHQAAATIVCLYERVSKAPNGARRPPRKNAKKKEEEGRKAAALSRSLTHSVFDRRAN